jgi:hypothetical protein
MKNWERPFQGFGNAAAYRTIVGATYVFWQDRNSKFLNEYSPWLNQDSHPVLFPVVIGMMTGVLNGMTLNNLQAIKFRMWSECGDSSPGFFKTAQNMYAAGGFKVFFRGLVITVQRDAVYGVVYESIRHSLWLTVAFQRGVAGRHEISSATPRGSPEAPTGSGPSPAAVGRKKTPRDLEREAIVQNFFASMIATAASSPFNYLRSLAYGSPVNSVPLRKRHLARSLLLQAHYVYLHGESYARIAYQGYPDLAGGRRHPLKAARWLNGKLNVGWGSVRMGLGMSLGQWIFAVVQSAMS